MSTLMYSLVVSNHLYFHLGTCVCACSNENECVLMLVLTDLDNNIFMLTQNFIPILMVK